MTALVTRANSVHLPLRDESVDLIVTSPPYFALRSYRDGGEHYDRQIGSEPTPQACLDCGEVWITDKEDEAKRERRDHIRDDHPTEDEAALRRIREVEATLPGCNRCGHDDHESKACPFVTPDLLRNAGGVT